MTQGKTEFGTPRWKDHPPMENPRALCSWGFAPGDYINNCLGCEEAFIGDKWATFCYDCAKKASEKPVPKKITEMWAWVCTEPDGGEGVPAIQTAHGALPMMGADRERIESLRPEAMSVATELGLPIKLVRFHDMEELERHEPPVKAGQA